MSLHFILFWRLPPGAVLGLRGWPRWRHLLELLLVVLKARSWSQIRWPTRLRVVVLLTAGNRSTSHSSLHHLLLILVIDLHLILSILFHEEHVLFHLLLTVLLDQHCRVHIALILLERALRVGYFKVVGLAKTWVLECTESVALVTLFQLGVVALGPDQRETVTA